MTEFALRPDAAGPRSGSDLLFSNRIRVHFVGIGAIGMSGIAGAPLRRGDGIPGPAVGLARRVPTLPEAHGNAR